MHSSHTATPGPDPISDDKGAAVDPEDEELADNHDDEADPDADYHI